MDNIETSNGIIESTMFGIEDHGILTFSLLISGDGCVQGFGGISLERGKPRKGWGRGFELIRDILETLGVRKWEELLGTHCRIKHSFTKIHSIGHIIENRWVNIYDYTDDTLRV